MATKHNRDLRRLKDDERFLGSLRFIFSMTGQEDEPEEQNETGYSQSKLDESAWIFGNTSFLIFFGNVSVC